MQGWIKLYRKLKEWEWINNPNTLVVFIHLLLNANHKDGQWQGVVIKSGSLVTGRKSLAKQTGLTEQIVRTSLLNLKKTKELTIKSTNKFSIITLNNWSNYQQIPTSNLTNNQPTTNQQLTTNKNDKNVKNDKNILVFLNSFNKYFGSKYKLTDGRTKKLTARSKVFSLDQILKAVKNLASSEWHQGKNDRNWKADPDFLIRSDEQIDKWLNYQPEKETNKIKHRYIDI